MEGKEGGNASICLYIVLKKFLESGVESPRGRGKLGFVQRKSDGFPITPVPASVVLPRKAARQSELIVTHSGKSSLALAHMVARCARGQEGRGVRIPERNKELHFQT